MKFIKLKVLYFVFFALTSCQSNVDKESIEKINGYWEILKVRLPDGEHKDYKVNETIDFFELKKNKGFRQKLMPQFNGKYKTNGIKESIVLSENKGLFFLEYKTDYGKWREEIVELQDSLLILKNDSGIEYEYKRYLPFSIK